MEPEGRASYQEGEWEEWKTVIIGELVKALHDEMARESGQPWQSRIRNHLWAISLAEKQLAIPY
jgi:hypothetical protein